MKRLTRRKEDGTAFVQLYSDPDRPTDVIAETARKEREVIERLAHYEDLEEQGRLVELPCAMGDTVYAIRYGEETDFIIIETHIMEIKQNINGIFFVTHEVIPAFKPEDFGRIVFLTREEAEAKLTEKEGGTDETD